MAQQLSTLQKARNFAQYFTMTAAVIFGLFWIIVGISGKSSAGINLTNNILIVAVSAGGILMGLLFVADGGKKR